jgi:hypothetical protein
MLDERRLYMKQLLRNYKQSIFDVPVGFTINYTTQDCVKHHRLISNNEGIDMAIQYIDELEHKVDELQHIERIINLAKENQ